MFNFLRKKINTTSAKHHSSIRKRIYRDSEKYPHPHPHKRLLDYLIYLVGILSPAFTLPQVIVIWRNQSAENVPLLTWLPYLTFSMVWLWYGVSYKQNPIIFLNGGLVLVNFAIVLGIFVHG